MRATLILIALAVGGHGLSFAYPVFAQQEEAAALTVTVTRPVERQWQETVTASGWLKPWHEAIIAAEIDSLRITDVLVDIGTLVSKGQPVVRLADESVRAELRRAEALLASARADLEKATANADRARQVSRSGALSDEKITEYLIAEQTAIAGVASAEASAESQRIRLTQTIITAPDDGLITARSAHLGTVVSPGTELFRLMRQQRIEWQAEISSRHLAMIKVGQTAIIDGPGKQGIEGTVRLVAPTVSADTGRVTVYIPLPVEARVPVGLHVTGRIELGTNAALVVPETAIVPHDGMTYAFTVDRDRRVSRQRVETGRRRDGEVEILSGLDRSAEVVSAGGAFLSDGALVRVQGPAP